MSDVPIRIVDLFCGCGGLSLGFDEFSRPEGSRPYRTVLGLDNWEAALKVFNRNLVSSPSATFPIGRRGDLLWFDHASEALLFYLVHLAYSGPDDDLQEELRKLGVFDFLCALASVDHGVTEQLEVLGATTEYVSALSKVDRQVFGLAVCKSAVGRLHLSSLRDLRLAFESLPWTHEYSLLTQEKQPLKRPEVAAISEYAGAAQRVWERVIQQVDAGSTGVGRGQHKVNPSRMNSLAAFLSSSAGLALKKLWSDWCARRLSVRERFCLAAYPALRNLYTEARRVHLLLGGPPCKGFSRIGRAVIRELRKQGAHAWASDAFGDERNALMYKYVLFVEALRPSAFIFENVSNFASTLKTPDGELNAPQLLEELIDDLDCDSLHYSIDARILRAKDHSIPQARERFIMCGISSTAGGIFEAQQVLRLKKSSEEVPLLFALSGLSRPKEVGMESREGFQSAVVGAGSLVGLGDTESSREFLAWIRAPKRGESMSPNRVDGHIFRRPREDDARVYRLFAPGIRWMDMKTPAAFSVALIKEALTATLTAVPSNRRAAALMEKFNHAQSLLDDSLALRLLLEHMSRDMPDGHHLLEGGYLANGVGRHGDWLERLSATKPCKTIVAHIGKDTYGYIHPFEPRPITIREAARIQTFPDWFSFSGVGIVDAYSMIGNAVPPLLANQLADRLWTLNQEKGLFLASVQARKFPKQARSRSKQAAIPF